MDQLTKLLATKPLPDARAAVFEALGSAPRPAKVLEALVPAIATETSEPALLALLSAVARHADDAARGKVAPLLTTLITNPKTTIALRRAAISSLSSLFPSSYKTKDSETLSTSLLAVLNKLVAAGPAWPSKEGKEGYFSETAHGAGWLVSTSRSPTGLAQPIQTFLKNDKLFSRMLHSEGDKTAFLEALSGCAVAGSAAAWGWICTDAGGDWKVRRAAVERIRGLVSTATEKGDGKSVDKWGVLACEAGCGVLLKGEKETPKEEDDGPGAWPVESARSGGSMASRGWELVCAGVPKSGSSARDEVLMSALVLSRMEGVKRVCGDGAWGRLAEGSAGVVARAGETFARRVLETEVGEPPVEPWRGTLHAGSPGVLREATLDALEVVARLDTGPAIGTLVRWAFERIRETEIGGLSAEDCKIWRTPEGSLAFDPVAAKRAKAAERAAQSGAPRTKAEKFDAELRKELAAKGKEATTAAAPEKLSKEEKELQDAQFKKEGEVRFRAEGAVRALKNAFGVLKAVIEASADADAGGDLLDDEEMEMESEDRLAPYIAEAVETILQGFIVGHLARSGASETLAGALAADAIETYIALGDCAGWRLGAAVQPPRLQAATLRAYGVKSTDTTWKGVSLQGGLRASVRS